MLYSNNLLCFYSLLVFKHAELLLTPIGLNTGNSCLLREIFGASPLRCTPIHGHNDIIVLIKGKPNTPHGLWAWNCEQSWSITIDNQPALLFDSAQCHQGFEALQADQMLRRSWRRGTIDPRITSES